MERRTKLVNACVSFLCPISERPLFLDRVSSGSDRQGRKVSMKFNGSMNPTKEDIDSQNSWNRISSGTNPSSSGLNVADAGILWAKKGETQRSAVLGRIVTKAPRTSRVIPACFESATPWDCLPFPRNHNAHQAAHWTVDQLCAVWPETHAQAQKRVSYSV